MALPKIYSYDRETFEFIGEGVASVDPVASTPKKKAYMVPGFATAVKPATYPAPSGKANVFDPAKGAWSLVEDHRGTLYDTATGAAVQHDRLGPIPDGLTDLVPAPSHVWDAATGTWVLDVAKLIDDQRARISSDCADAITAGLACTALGASHTYPTSERDQANLAAQVLAAQTGSPGPFKFWCADAAGSWARRAHTGAEILAVGEAVRLHVTQQQDQYEALLGQLAALNPASPTIEADIAAIIWK